MTGVVVTLRVATALPSGVRDTLSGETFTERLLGPLGIDVDSFTRPEKPSWPLMLTVRVPEEPGCTWNGVGFVERLNPGALTGR